MTFIERLKNEFMIQNRYCYHHKIIQLLHCSKSSIDLLLDYLCKHEDSSIRQQSFDTLLDDERGYTIERLCEQQRMKLIDILCTMTKNANYCKQWSKILYTRWMTWTNGDFIFILSQLSQCITTKIELIETTLKHFLIDNQIRFTLRTHLLDKLSINNGLLPVTMPNYIEYLFLWRLLCQLEEMDDDNEFCTIQPDFHKFLAFFYKLCKKVVDIPNEYSQYFEYIISEHVLILCKYDTADAYIRKCIEAICCVLFIHYGYNCLIVKYTFVLNDLVFNNDWKKQTVFIAHTINDIIKRCIEEQKQHEKQFEKDFEQEQKLSFIKCITIMRTYIDHENEKRNDGINIWADQSFLEVLNSLIIPGLQDSDCQIRGKTLEVIYSLSRDSSEEACNRVQQLVTVCTINLNSNDEIRTQAVQIIIDIILMHGLEKLTTMNNENESKEEKVNELRYLIKSFLNGLYKENSIDMQCVVVNGLIKLILSNRLQSYYFLSLLLTFLFTNDEHHRYCHANKDLIAETKCLIKKFFYFFVHTSTDNLQLFEEFFYRTITLNYPFSDNKKLNVKYIFVQIDAMCKYCIELLSLPTLPVHVADLDHIPEQDEKEQSHNPHFRLARRLLLKIHSDTQAKSPLVIASFVHVLKYCHFKYLTKSELEYINNLIIKLYQYQNLSQSLRKTIKSIEDKIHSLLIQIHKLQQKLSPSGSTSINSRKRKSSLSPLMSSSPSSSWKRTSRHFSLSSPLITTFIPLDASSPEKKKEIYFQSTKATSKRLFGDVTNTTAAIAPSPSIAGKSNRKKLKYSKLKFENILDLDYEFDGDHSSMRIN
ncbi:unnamed protein product [Didymodactylos carnosus]|uniref:Nuclear condensin complex subunit 3 C-terminal domain-containing protein n=1 Tax=Didymodactylos carnosus TaxID=1234261 RepID=A0A8S2GF42_9BILA|nr:unnamed protein product [Didymodactylos carnosus]CAF3509963.1 unnamed protein product [Didymodactylos carnosus]